VDTGCTLYAIRFNDIKIRVFIKHSSKRKRLPTTILKHNSERDFFPNTLVAFTLMRIFFFFFVFALLKVFAVPKRPNAKIILWLKVANCPAIMFMHIYTRYPCISTHTHIYIYNTVMVFFVIIMRSIRTIKRIIIERYNINN